MSLKEEFQRIPMPLLKWVSWDGGLVHLHYKDGRTQTHVANEIILTNDEEVIPIKE